MSICEYSLYANIYCMKNIDYNLVFSYNYPLKVKYYVLPIAFITGHTESVISIYKCSNPIISVCVSKKH